MDSQPVAWIKFEDDVFKHVQDWLGNGLFFVNPLRAAAYRKRSYHSEPRKSDIEFEVAIEAFDDGATEPSLVWVWECKDHGVSERLGGGRHRDPQRQERKEDRPRFSGHEGGGEGGFRKVRFPVWEDNGATSFIF